MSEELTYVQKLEKDYLRLEAENDRYKQALEEIVSFDDFVDSLDYADNILRIAFRALQGDAE